MKMKVIELLNKISKGENPDFKMNGGSYKNSVWSFINMYFGHKILTFEEIICWLNAEVEIIEDEEEIDIQSIEEIVGNTDVRMNNKEISAEDYFYTITNIVLSINELKNKQNESLKAVKQLDKNIKELR